jgi:hypothetical protein
MGDRKAPGSGINVIRFAPESTVNLVDQGIMVDAGLNDNAQKYVEKLKQLLGIEMEMLGGAKIIDGPRVSIQVKCSDNSVVFAKKAELKGKGVNLEFSPYGETMLLFVDPQEMDNVISAVFMTSDDAESLTEGDPAVASQAASILEGSVQPCGDNAGLGKGTTGIEQDRRAGDPTGGSKIEG